MSQKLLATGLVAVLVAGCGSVTNTSHALTFSAVQIEAVEVGLQAFEQVVETVEPVAEKVCRERTIWVNCNFKIIVDDRPNQPANAFQTLDESGRPIIAFTRALISDAKNSDELAFVMGHEAAHHIANHIARQQRSAAYVAVISGIIEVLRGSGAEVIEAARWTGAQVGARTYSKDFELEADALGTIITARAGYDPLRGAQFFARIPDPGDKFLGTHPPNNQRLETVRRTAAGL